MSLNWDRLRVLDAVARTGSVGHAAEALYMSGPAVSQQLRRIEAETGTKVVEPHGRGLRLAPDGEVLAAYARQVSDLMQQAENELHSDGDSRALVGHVRVGAVASAVRSSLGEALVRLRAEYPGLEVTVSDGETVDHLQQLSDGTLDLVFAESWSGSPLRLPAGVTAQEVATEEVCIVLPADHPAASRPSVSINELASEHWATCAPGSDAHVALQQLARKHGVELDVPFHLADHLTQLSLVRRGLAVACLPRSADPGDGTVRFVRLDASLHEPLHRSVLLLSAARVPSLAQRAVERLISPPDATARR